MHVLASVLSYRQLDFGRHIFFKGAGSLRGFKQYFYQHVTCATRGDTTLDHLYSTLRNTYMAVPRPPFGKSDHTSILLLPAYKQKLKQEVPVMRSIRKWYDEADAMLQDCFASTDWKMFQSLATLISASTTSSPQWLYIHMTTRSHGLQATSAPS